ncbi:MAG: hypothetical protein AB1297_07650 [bacterium]
MFRNKMILGLILIVGLGLMAESAQGAWWQFWKKEAKVVAQPEVKSKPVKGEAKEKGTQAVAESQGTFTAQKIQKETQIEEYVPEVIIKAKWQKVEEKLVPIEGDPWGGWISCATEIYGEFRTGTVSFGFWHQNIEPFPPVMPHSITIDEEENLYILDPVNFRILKFNKDGKYLETINLERVKSKKGQLGRFEIAEECDIGEESIKIHAAQDRIYIKGLKFSKAGRFIGTSSPRFEEKGYKQLSPNKVIKDDRTVYEVVFGARKEEEKKKVAYKVDPSDERLKNIEGIKWFLKRREESIKKIEEEETEKLMEEMYGKEGYPRKDGKITLYAIEGGYEWYENLKVIKWQKKE